jgi:hypothetical protein
VVLALRFFSPLLKTGLKLPDISELNGTAIDSVAEFDGLTVTAAAPAVPSPAAAYSVRLLDSAVGVSSYTGAAMRVRRVTGTGNTGNDDEADVAFDTSLTEPTISLDSAVSNFSAGGSNATTLGQFLNVGTVGGTTYTDADSLAPNTAAAYVDEWKDQSGNANHATQGTPSNQPQIHSGTVNTDLNTENGKPFLKFRGGNGGNESLSMTSQVSCETIFSVLANDTAGFLAYYLFTTGANLGFYSGGTFQVSVNGPGVLATNTLGSISGTVTGQTLLYNDHNGTGWEVGQDGGTASQVIATSNKAIDQIVRPSTNLQVEKFQECIIWDSDQSSNRTAIESDINTYFSIY